MQQLLQLFLNLHGHPVIGFPVVVFKYGFPGLPRGTMYPAVQVSVSSAEQTLGTAAQVLERSVGLLPVQRMSSTVAPATVLHSTFRVLVSAAVPAVVVSQA
jgi:hypothetical protein